MAGHLIDANDPRAVTSWYRIDAPIPLYLSELELDGIACALEWVLAPLGVWADQIAITTLGQSIFVGNTVADPTFPATQAETLAADLDELLGTTLAAGDLTQLIDVSPDSITYSCHSSSPLTRGIAAAAMYTMLSKAYADGTLDPSVAQVTMTDNGTDNLDLEIVQDGVDFNVSVLDATRFVTP